MGCTNTYLPEPRSFATKITIATELFYDYTESSIYEASVLVEVACKSQYNARNGQDTKRRQAGRVAVIPVLRVSHSDTLVEQRGLAYFSCTAVRAGKPGKYFSISGSKLHTFGDALSQSHFLIRST